MKPKSSNRFLFSLRRLFNNNGITLALALTASPLHAAGGSWNVDAAGSWETAGNWSPAAVPGTAEGDVVNLLFNITAARTVTIGTGVTATVGDLNIGDPTATVFAYTLAAGGTGSIRLDGTGTADATVDFTSNVINTISAPITLVDNGVLRSNVVSQHVLSGIISGTGKSLTLNNDVDGVVTAPTLTSGQFALNAANTYTGGTNISDVRVSVGNAAGLGTGAVNITGAGQVFLSSAITVPNSITLNSTGWAETGFNFGSLRLDAGTISGGITLAQNSTVGSNSGTGNLSGVISGAFSLTKTGAGTIALTNTTAANSYSGGTTISQGTLSIGTGGTGSNTARTDALGTGAVTVNSTGTLKLWIQNSTAFTIANNLTVNGGTILNQDGNHTLSGTLAVGSSGATLQAVFSGKNLTIGGQISGSGPTTIAGGGGAVILSGTNSTTYSGAMSVSSGTLQIASAANLSSGSLSFTAASTGLNVTGTAVTIPNNISLGAVSGNINLDTPNSSSTIFNGTISGGGASSVWFLRGGAAGQNTGSITLNGTNTLLGTINVQRGPLILGNSAAAGSASILLDSNKNPNGALQLAGNFTISNNVAINSGTTQPIGVATGLSAGISGVISSSVAGNGIDKVGAGTLTTTATNTFSGPTTVTAGTLQLDYASNDTSKLADSAALNMAGGTLNLNSAFPTSHVELVSGTNVIANSSITRTGSSNNKIALGSITNAGGSLNLGGDSIATTTTPLTNGLLPSFITVNGALATKDGSDNIIAYAGYTDVNRLGGAIPDLAGANVRIVEAGSTGNVTLAASGTTNIGTLINAGTVASTLVDIGAGNTLRLNDLGSISAGNNGLTISNGTLTAGGTANTAGTVDILNGSATVTSVSSVIADNGTGVVNLAKSGTGVLAVSAANTYTGTTTVNGGTLALSGGSSIPNAGAVTLANNAGVTLRLDSSETIGSLTAGAASTLSLQGNTLTLTGASSSTVAGSVSGTGGSLVKQGAGTLTLSGANTYTGGTTLSAGAITATINSTQNSLGTGAASIASGTTLTLNNTNTGAVNVPITNTFTGTGLLKVSFAANTTGRSISLSGISGFTGTIQLSNLGSTGDKWGLAGVTTSAPVIVDNGSQLYPNTTPSTLSGGITVSGTGNSEARGAIRLATTLGGNITLAGDTTIGAEGGTLTGNITSNAGTAVTLTVGTANAGTASSFTGIISDGTNPVAVTKAAGTGIMTLAGINTYTGATTISAGTLNLTGSAANSALSLAASTSLSGEGTVASLNTTGATSLAINAATAGAFTATGAFTPGSGAVTTVSLTANNTPTSGTVRVLNYGSTTATATNFAFSGSASFRSTSFVVGATSTDLLLGSANLTWTGAGTTNWDVNTTANWVDATPAASKFYLADAVTFDDSPAGTAQTVALTTTVQPSSITFNNTTDTYSLTGTTGAIIGTTGITKNGTANVTLAGGTAQNYTGPIAVNAGTLSMGSATAFGQTSGITIASGAAVDNNGQSPGTVATGGYSFTIAGNGPSGGGALVNNSATSVASNAGVKFLTLSGNASVGGVSRFDIGAANAAGVGTINGGGFTLTKVGANQISMRAPASNITYVVNAGTMWFEDQDGASGTNAITVNGTALLGTYGPRTIANNVTFASGTTLTNIGGAVGTWTGAFTLGGAFNVDTTNQSIVIDGSISGSGTITRAGGNTLYLQESSTGFSGKIVNNAGTLRVEGNSALGTGSGADVITMANGSTLQFGTISGTGSGTIGTVTQGITQTLGATYDATTGNTLTIDGAITGTGTLNKANNSGHVIFNRAITSTGGVSANGGTQTYNGNASFGASFDVGTNIVTNLNSPVFTASAGMNFWTGTTNIAVGTGSTTSLSIGNTTSQAHTINQTAGAFTATSKSLLGHWGSETSVYNLSGGSFNQPDTVTSPTDEAQANFFIGIDGSGILNVSGTGVLNTTSLVVNGRSEGNNLGQDAVNLTGGRINLGKWGMRTQGTTYAVNLGGGTMGASADWSSSLNMALTGTGGNVTFNTLDSVNSTTARTITLSGTLSGTGGLIKSGAGNLVLTGTKSYTGTTVVNGGTLYPGASLTTSALSVNSGGTIAPGTAATAGTSAISFLSLNGGTVSMRADYTAGDLINANVLTVPTPSSISITPVSNLLPGDTLTLIDYNGTIGGLGFGGLSLNPLANPHYLGTLVDDTVNTRIQVSIDIDPVIWLGNVDGTWDVNTTSNWKTFSNDLTSKFITYDIVQFTDEGAATPVVNLVGSIQPLSVTFDATTDYTLTGAGITGTSGLEKKNTNTVTLLNSNSYTGLTKISSGTLQVGDGGTLGTLGGAGDIALAGSLEFNRSDSVTLNRVITGSGTLRKRGTGTLVANNTTALFLPTNLVVDAGTLEIASGSFSGNRMNGVGQVLVNTGGTLLLSAAHSLGGDNLGMNEQITLNGGTLTLNREQYITTMTLNGALINGTNEIRVPNSSNYTVTGSAPSVISARVSMGFSSPNWKVEDVTSSPAADLTISGQITNTYPLTKSGVGTMVLSGNNNYTGGTNLNGGTLEASSIADAGGVGSIGAYTTGLPGYLGIANDSTFRYTGTGTESSARNLWLDTGTQNKTIEVTSATADITFSGTGGNINRPFTKTGPGALTLADVINVGATVTVNGGKLTLTGVNTYTGDTTVESGTLAINGTAIADTNKLIVNSGKVEVSGTEVVDTLYFGATQQAAGTWGATGSGAAHIDNVHFSGTGVVSVTTGPAGYPSWIGTFYPGETNPAIVGATADPDSDGIPNAIEFVIGGNPVTGMDAARLPSIELVTTNLGSGPTDYLKFTFRRSDASAILNPAAQYDTDLAGTWTTAVNGTAGVIVQTDDNFYDATPGNGIDRVIYYIPRSLAAPGSSLFGRLSVTVP